MPKHHQLSIPPMPLGNSEQPHGVFRNSEQDAANLFNAACEEARLSNKDIAHLCGVSISLVEKWRSPDARGCPSFVQLLMLPPRFHLELHRALNKHYGFGRQALLDLLDAVGRLSLGLGDR